MSKIRKGSVVIIDYETIVEGKVVDSSKMHKPLEIVFLQTPISEELSKNIKGKEKGHKFEIIQKIDSKPVKTQFPMQTFNDETIEVMKKDKEVELEVNGYWYPFKVLEISPDTETVTLEYSDPYAGKRVIHKLEIKDVKNNILNEKKE